MICRVSVTSFEKISGVAAALQITFQGDTRQQARKLFPYRIPSHRRENNIKVEVEEI
jgi:hypothetical protein